MSVRVIHCFDRECANVFFGIVYTYSLDKALVSHISLLVLHVQDTHLKRKLVGEN
jgi:hypothetical protein